MTFGEAPVQSAPIVPDAAPCVHLVIHKGAEAGTKISCRRVVTLLGARKRCKVTLTHKSIAPVHVAIVNNGAEVRVVDLVTPSGSKLNGLKLENEKVNDGDVLAIGPWEFRMDVEDPPQSADADAQSFDLEPTPQVVALEHIATHRLLQPNRAVCIIGRRKGCDIAISDNRVSRVHALLLTYLGHPAIFDLLSKHHTFVNDEPISFRMLKNEDLITVGESRFRVRAVGSSVGRTNSKGPKLGATPELVRLEPAAEDQIDIKNVESSQTWQIADNLEKASRNR